MTKGASLETEGTARLVELLEKAGALIFVKDGAGRYLHANRRFCDFLDVAERDILGRRDCELVIDPRFMGVAERLDLEALSLSGRVFVHQGARTTAEPTRRFLVTRLPLQQLGGSVPATCTILTETDGQMSPNDNNHPQFYDLLTDLPSKSVFIKRVQQVVARARQGKTRGALLLLDLDQFQLINDAHGYDCGDRILREVSQRLMAGTFARDTVCRTGGDEFAVLLTAVGKDRDACCHNVVQAAEKLKSILTQAPFDVAGIESSLTVSVGIALLTAETCSVNQVLHDAELAMHQAKSLGGNRIIFHKREMQIAVRQRLEMEQGLRAALDAKALQMVVQPQGDVDGTFSGAELLARWHHPSYGAIAPDIFIPLAERTGLIQRVTDWSLEVACALSRRLVERGSALPISVNISPVCLMACNFIQRVQAVLERSGVSGTGLVFEITEGTWLHDAAATELRIRALADLGIRFSVDDFGTGYSNLSYLKDLSLYEVKIDQGLVRDLPSDADSCVITELTLTMAQRLGLRTTAEGVETESQAQFLLQHGCDALQGYLVARPMPIDDWLENL